MDNVLFVSGLALLYVGVLRFFNQRERRGPLIAFCAVVTLIVIYFTYLNDDLTARRVTISFAMAAMSFLIAQGLFVHKTRSVTASAPGSMPSSTFFMASAWALWASARVIRV